MFEAVLQAIKAYDRIILHRHHRPDGDAMGSQIGMKHLLVENFPEKQVYMVGDNPGFFGFMDDSVMDEIPDSAYEGALAIILDSGSRSMICDDRYALAKATVRLDHHIFCEKIADTEVIDTTEGSELGKHGGGDNEIMRHLVSYLRTGEQTLSLTSIDDSVEGHLCVYAAETSRKEKRTIDLADIR